MPRKNIKSLTRVALMCAIMCVSANIYIPLALPVTLQTLVLYFSLFLLGARQTLAVVGIYITLGALGLPVFSGFSGGIGRLLDATGGYILGMLAAVLVWWLLDTLLGNIRYKRPILCVFALSVIYAVGALWYALVYLGGAEHLAESVLVGVLPFILPDILKISVAHILSARLERYVR